MRCTTTSCRTKLLLKVHGTLDHSEAANGLALCGLRPFVSTFLVFSDYMTVVLGVANVWMIQQLIHPKKTNMEPENHSTPEN